MLRKRKPRNSLVVGVGLSALVIGAIIWAMKSTSLSQLQPKFMQTEAPLTNSALIQLVELPPSDRIAQLEALAQGPKSLDRSRSRYILASDLIEQKQGKKALQWLEGLEQEYPLLASYVALKRAQAYELIGDKTKTIASWQELLNNYGNDPVAAYALLALGQTNPKYWDQAIAQFPSHPSTLEIVRLKLQQNPKQLPLMMLMVKYGFYRTDINTILEQLLTQKPPQLKSEDWELIGFAYWEKQLYGKAAIAYARANPTPRNLYRAARGLQLDGKGLEGKPIYRQLVKDFPDAKETAIALLRLAKLAEPKDASFYLDRAIEHFPDQAGEALLNKADILDSLSSAKSAYQARQLLLTQYSQSESAAQVRWKIAKQRLNLGDLQGAWQWAQQITAENPNSELAPEASFWVGKWAAQLGHSQEAKTSFEYTLSKYPESYYAWRSAVLLGKKVGDFNNINQLMPVLKRPLRTRLLTGSTTLQELYLLGQDQDAWTLWQVEFKNPIQPTVAEQFTDGLMRIGVGDRLDGIFMVSSLDRRDTPEERSQYLAIRQQIAYWQALYPFPYFDLIEKWSKQHTINPLLVNALIRQESRFMPSIKSSVGATGLMQVMPETASWVAEKIPLKTYQLNHPSDNIAIGTWYLDHIHDEYKNNSLLAVASYNAGPGNVTDWVQKYGFKDPDEFIENIPFPETKDYVKAVFENYWNYLRFYTNQGEAFALATKNT